MNDLINLHYPRGPGKTTYFIEQLKYEIQIQKIIELMKEEK